MPASSTDSEAYRIGVQIGSAQIQSNQWRLGLLLTDSNRVWAELSSVFSLLLRAEQFTRITFRMIQRVLFSLEELSTTDLMEGN